MLQLLAVAAFVLASSSAVFLAVLVGRRVSLASREVERAELRARLIPVALELVDGEGVPSGKLSRREEEALADALGELSKLVRGDARARIAGFFAGSASLRHQLAALSSRRSWKRATAASRLGDMGSPTARPALRDALRDPERDVRAAAARSLGLVGDAESAGEIVEQLADGRLPRGLAAHALLQIGPAALPRLRELTGHPDEHVRAVVLKLLGHAGDSSDAARAEQALVDPAAGVRAAAAEALGRIGTAASARRLRVALGDRIGFVAAAAAEALGQLVDREAGPALAALARGGGYDVARAAAQALGRIDPDGLRRTAALDGAGPHLSEAADLLALDA